MSNAPRGNKDSASAPRGRADRKAKSPQVIKSPPVPPRNEIQAKPVTIHSHVEMEATPVAPASSARVLGQGKVVGDVVAPVSAHMVLDMLSPNHKLCEEYDGEFDPERAKTYGPGSYTTRIIRPTGTEQVGQVVKHT